MFDQYYKGKKARTFYHSSCFLIWGVNTGKVARRLKNQIKQQSGLRLRSPKRHFLKHK